VHCGSAARILLNNLLGLALLVFFLLIYHMRSHPAHLSTLPAHCPELNGCRTRDFTPLSTCLVDEFEDGPHWIDAHEHEAMYAEAMPRLVEIAALQVGACACMTLNTNPKECEL
jgi:hypothetical protein